MGALGKLRRMDLRDGVSVREALAFEAEIARNYISQLELGSKPRAFKLSSPLCE